MLKKYNEFIVENFRNKLSPDFISNDWNSKGLITSDVNSLEDILNTASSENISLILPIIQKVLVKIRKREVRKDIIPNFFSTINSFFSNNIDFLKGYDVSDLIDDYNHLVSKYGLKELIIKAWLFESVTENYKDYIDSGCCYIRTYLDDNPEIDEDEFGEYVTQHNKADRDMGELQDVSKEEIERLGKEYRKKLNEGKTRLELKEEQQRSDEKRYLSAKERKRLNDSQRKYLVNKRKEHGSYIDDELQKKLEKEAKGLTEGLRSKLKANTEADIRRKLSQMDILDRIKEVTDLELDDSYLPTDEEISNAIINLNSYEKLNTLDEIRLTKKYEKDVLGFLSRKDDHIITEESFADTEMETVIKELLEFMGSNFEEVKLYDSESDYEYYETIDSILSNIVHGHVNTKKTITVDDFDYDFVIFLDKKIAFLNSGMGEAGCLIFDIGFGK